MLPIRTNLYKDESFISWFCRLSFLNGTDPQGLALYIWNQDSQLYKDLDRQLSHEHILKLVNYTRVPYDKILKSTLEPYIQKVNSSFKDTIYNKWYFLLPLGQKGRIRLNGTSICSKCLKQQDSYINKYWRVTWLIACPIHKLKLITHCPNCDNAILPQKLDYLNPNIYLCNKCHQDFREVKTNIINNDLLEFQNKLLYTFKLGKITSKNSFNLLITNSAKDLFLTLHILLAFYHKILRQKSRFISLIKELNLNMNYTFTQQNNATFNRLNIKDRMKLINEVRKVFNWNIHKFIITLKETGITSVILKQTFKNISPTIMYVVENLSNKKLIRNIYRTKCEIKPKSHKVVTKLFLELNLYVNYEYQFKILKKRLIQSNKNLSHNLTNSNVLVELSRPKVSHQILQKRMFYILNDLNNCRLTNKYIITSMIGYFHWIWIPITDYIIKSSSNESFIIRIGKNDFLFPF